MKVLYQFTKRNLVQNKHRTIVTIIGVVLISILMFGIGLGFSTLRESMIIDEYRNVGKHHVLYTNVPYQSYKTIIKDKNVDIAEYSKSIDFAYFSNGKYEFSIQIFDRNSYELNYFNLLSGNYPKNGNEIIVSNYLSKKLQKDVNDKISLNEKEYISNNLYIKIKEAYPDIIPSTFNLDLHNENVLERDYTKYKNYFDNMYKGIDENIHLDKEQIKAILRDEDYSLIIAGAGTGKTTTMASKVKYLVDIKKISPSKIVVMSFTKKATQELEERIKIDFEIPANTTTFHSLGYSYIKEIFNKRKCYVIDSSIREKIFIDYFKERIFPYKEQIKEILKIFSFDKINKSWVFSKYFKENRIEKDINREDYPKTIQGEMVKSIGEARIANYLYINGIEYQYEKIYKELMEDNKIYKPDFTLNLNGEEVYIEYFGLSNYDESNTAIKRYNYIRNKKENYHKQAHTKNIRKRTA